jgi:hypothetical protein
MKTIAYIFILAFSLNTQAQTSTWNQILQKHVDAKGWINYKGIKADRAQLNTYLAYLAETKPTHFSADKQKAFWMNAYNAYTVKMILDHYPLKSITDIKKDGKTAWEIPYATVGGKLYTLNAIEHEILRKNYDDPRIHAGINCASYSCPPILNTAFTEKNVNTLLEKAFKNFVNDPLRNNIEADRIQISQLFDWFKGDFTKKGSLIDYLNQYAKVKIKPNAKIEYMDYNWSLNTQK